MKHRAVFACLLAGSLSLALVNLQLAHAAETKTFTYAYGGATLSEGGLVASMSQTLIDCEVTLSDNKEAPDAVECTPLKAVGDNSDSKSWPKAMVEQLQTEKSLKKDRDFKRGAAVFSGQSVKAYCADTFGDPDIMDKEAECRLAKLGRLSWAYHPTADDGPEQHALRLVAVRDGAPEAPGAEVTKRWSTWLKGWTDAQNAGDFKAYSALYDDGFLAEGAKKPLKKKAWLKTQKDRFKERMVIKVQDLKVRQVAGFAHLSFQEHRKGGVMLDQSALLMTVRLGDTPTIISEHRLVSAPGSEVYTYAYGGYVQGGDEEEEPKVGVSFVSCRVGGASGPSRPASCSTFETVGMGFDSSLLTDALQTTPSAKLLKKDRSLKKTKVNIMGETTKALCSKPASGGGDGDQGDHIKCYVENLGLIQSKGYYDGASYEEHIVRLIPSGTKTASDEEKERWQSWLESWLEAQNACEFKAYSALYAEEMTGVAYKRGKAKTMKRKAWLKARKNTGAFYEENYPDLAIGDLRVSIAADRVYLLFDMTDSLGGAASRWYRGPTLLIVSKTDNPKILFEEMMLSFTL